MARSLSVDTKADAASGDLSPLVGADGPTLATALQALITWSTSTTVRERLMAESDFPLSDLPAFLLVNQLIYRGAARPTDLADAIQTGRSNVSKIVRRLEQAGLVFRIADRTDDRAVVVALTDAGRATGHRILSAAGQLNLASTETWTEDELQTLETLLIKAARTIDALPGHPLATTTGVAFPSQ